MNINALRQAQDRIAEAIKALKKTRNEHEEYLKPIETRTRQLLIDPMLEALGWDVQNPAQVHLEYKGTSANPITRYSRMATWSRLSKQRN